MLLLIVCLLQVVGYAAKVNTLTIYFAKDKYMVTGDEGQKLYALKNADLIMLHGHTDADGSNAYNEQLSVNRVNEVKRIVAQICPKARIETKHYGEYQPINTNEDETAKTANRRVEISYISDPLLSTKVPVQTFSIDNRSEQTITCKQGTQVVIPAGAFADANVSINVSEYYDLLQIFSANLSTKCNGAPIETAGMIYITAEANGKNVQPNKELTYKFPRSNQQQDFYLFEGKRDSSYSMNWVLLRDSANNKDDAMNEAIAVENGYVSIGNLRAKVLNGNESTFGGLVLTTQINGVRRSDFDAVVSKMADGFSNNDFVDVQDCLVNASVDIEIAASGRISSIRTSYADKNTACDRPLSKFFWKYMPQSFASASGDTRIRLVFTTKSIVREVPNILGVRPMSNAEKARYEAESIVFASTQLGWMNCDRFLGKSNNITYAVKCTPDATVRMAMNNYKAFYSSSTSGNLTNGKDTVYQYAFVNIPAGEPVTLISTKAIGDKIYLAIASATTKKGVDDLVFKYEEVSKEELEFRVRKLNIARQ